MNAGNSIALCHKKFKKGLPSIRVLFNTRNENHFNNEWGNGKACCICLFLLTQCEVYNAGNNPKIYTKEEIEIFFFSRFQIN